MNKIELINLFNEIGFDEYKEIEIEDIIIEEAVFKQCAQNTCGNFRKNHSCMGGSVEESKERLKKHNKAFLISKIVPIRTKKEMEESMITVDKAIKSLRKALEDEPVTVMGAGPCTYCKSCSALEGEECRFPDKIQYSMEGSGINVVRMAMNAKMSYNAGGGNIGYFALVLFNETE